MKAKALSVAGFDPSGGAGTLADVRTFNRYGVYGAAVVTALTFQDTRKVYGVYPLQPDYVKRQMEVLLSDMEFRAVKTGMLVNAGVVGVVADMLKRYKVKNVVVDPVIRSTSGAVLLDDRGIREMVNGLFPMATLVTPNVPEAEYITGSRIRNVKDMENAAESILEMGPKAVLIKGGHLGGEVVDLLRVRRPDGDRVYRFVDERLDVDVHGTGCVLSSSVAALLSRGCDVITAVSLAVSDMRKALRKGTVKVGKGRPVIFWTRNDSLPC